MGSIPISSLCPVCDRPIEDKGSWHHFLPKSRGGRQVTLIHRICHSKIHSLWTNRELETTYNTPEAVRAHPDMVRFIQWLQNKPPTYHDRSLKRRR